ncbi:MAG TPA: VWA domain-containing protein [Pyrinomonadaceae bacterium]|nr:VWA domain-containing protein [Pyrinomonadaceae bacterium]
MGCSKSLHAFFTAFNSGRGLFALLCLAIVCVTSLATAPIAYGQEAQTDDDVLRVNTELLIFPIRVRNRSKLPVETLAENELTLADKDKVTSGLYLRHGVDRVALIFALDQSGSTQQIITQQREAALGLLNRFGAQSQIAIIRFTAKPKLAVEFGRDLSAARDGFNFPAAENQRTALFDAADLAVKSFQVLPRVRSERRIVVLISDGLDNASQRKADEVIKAAIKDRISFYVIHIPLFTPSDGRLIVRPPSSGFRDLAEKTGGMYFLARDARSALAPETNIDLAPMFKAIEDDLRSQFLLGFYLSEAANDGRRHEFSLTMPDKYEYQIIGRGFSRKHKFFVANPREFLRRTQ